MKPARLHPAAEVELMYLVRATDIVVIAIAPFPREPAYWRERIRRGF